MCRSACARCLCSRSAFIARSDPVRSKNRNCRKEVSFPFPAWPRRFARSRIFWKSIANRLAWGTNGLGAHPGLRHGDGGSTLARIEYLAAENRILKAQLKGRLKLSDAERATLADIGHRLGRKVLAEVATVARRIARHSWVNSSSTLSIRYLRPSWVRSSTKS